MLDCKPIDTLMDPNVKLVPEHGKPLQDPGRYRRLVGKLNNLTITWPNISFPVSVVSQFLQSPRDMPLGCCNLYSLLCQRNTRSRGVV